MVDNALTPYTSSPTMANDTVVASPSPNALIPNGKGLLGALLANESGNRNIDNVDQGTSSGQAQGNFQITTGTWNDFAPKAGIDLKQYPTPHSAPWDVQAKVAAGIPLGRWDSSTLSAIKKAGYPVNPGATLGDNVKATEGSFDSYAPKGQMAQVQAQPQDSGGPTAQIDSNSPGLGGGMNLRSLMPLLLLQAMNPNHQFTPVSYDPFKVMPKLG